MKKTIPHFISCSHLKQKETLFEHTFIHPSMQPLIHLIQTFIHLTTHPLIYPGIQHNVNYLFSSCNMEILSFTILCTHGSTSSVDLIHLFIHSLTFYIAVCSPTPFFLSFLHVEIFVIHPSIDLYFIMHSSIQCGHSLTCYCLSSFSCSCEKIF